MKHRNPLPISQPAVVHLRRSYAESRYGQVHLWTAYPSGGGFDEGTPLICLHHGGGSGRLFAPILSQLGSDRSVYAPDLPGHGSSDLAGSKVTIADLAGVVSDVIDTMRLRSVDLFGHQLGALVAAELAILRPAQIRRIMLWGVPCHSAQERVTPLQSAGIPGGREDGSDLIEEWRRTLERRGPNAPMASCVQEFSDRLVAGAQGVRALAAAMEYPTLERLPLVRQPTLILRLRDEYWDRAARVCGALPNGSVLDLPDYGQGFLAAAAQRFSSVAREFLDR